MEDVTKAFREIQEQRRMNIAKSFGYQEEIIHDEVIDKGIQSENPFEQEYEKLKLEKSKSEDIEKSDIMNAINYDGEIRFNKTGKEIKEQIKNVVLPQKQAALEHKRNEIGILLPNCGEMPTKEPCNWWTNGIDVNCGYKIYSWSDCEVLRQNCGEVSMSLYDNNRPENCNCAENEEQAKHRRDYNERVEEFCRILGDIKTCESLMNNLKDEDKLRLTMQQLTAFKFS